MRNCLNSIDAVTSLRELFQLHPEIVESSMTTLLGACVRLIGDEVCPMAR
jgi:pre-rRNA-processing protein IPI1